MFFTNLQEEYEYIIDALEYEYKRINELVDKTNTLLFQQNITDDKSKEMIRELEEYLFYLDSFSFYIKRILEDSDKISFLSLKHNVFSIEEHYNNRIDDSLL